MVKCPNCGEENRDGLKVCLHCGCDLVKPESEPSKSSRHSGIGINPEPKKSSHKLRNGIIIFVILLVLFFIASAMTPYFLDMDSSIVNSIQSSDDSLDSFIDNVSSSSNNSIDLDTSSLSPTKTENFDGLFTMDIDKDMEFSEYPTDNENKWEKSWYYYGNLSENRYTNVYYWLVDESYDFDILDTYYGPETEGNLKIFTSKNKQESAPQHYDYFVMVGNDDEVVGIMGHDLNTLKNFARSVKF